MTIALITGGSRGLGRSMALHMADRGIDIILTYRNSEAEAQKVSAAIVEKGRKAAILQLDTAEHQSFERFAQSLQDILEKDFATSSLDILVNNAGTGLNKPLAQTTPEDIDLMYAIHLKGPLLLTQRLVPMMRDGGRILNISSGLTRFSLPGYGAYAMMKGGVEVMTRYWARELADRQIRVNTLAPGAIETDFGGGTVRDNRDVNDFVASVTALGRAGMPEDIGAAAAALVSGDLDWVTGQRIEASGGMFL